MPTLTFTSGNDSFVVNAAGVFDLTFLAGADNLTLQHAGAATTADMGDGADVVSHKLGTADVDGGLGADRFEIYDSGLTADGGADNDLFNIRGGTGLKLSGGVGVDRFNFYAASSSILIHGGDGSDDFFGYNHAITGDIHGGTGNDYFVLFRTGVTLHGGSGNDVYRADANSPATFVENALEGTDSVQVARGDDYTLAANIENISVQGFSGSTAGAATLTGNSSNNVINGHANVETINGLGGNDRLFGKGADDTISGGDGNDYLDGGDGNDTINGNAGDDTINGRAGDDTMIGGPGNDTYYVDSFADVVTELPGEGIDIARASIDYVLPDNVDVGIVVGSVDKSLFGNNLDNLLIGNASNNGLHGGIGRDTVRGGAGDDELSGGNGDDDLDGGPGVDTMVGGNGNDVYRVDNEFDWIDEFPGDGTDTVYVNVPATISGPPTYVLSYDIENAVLVSSTNSLRGNPSNNVVTGSAGYDLVFGDDGNDTLNGRDGDDNLWGENGADTINGGAGNDALFGGANGDLITGGSGVDTFYYTAVSDSVFGAFDYVFDVDAPNDVFDLSAIDADPATPLDQAFTLKSTFTFTPGDLWIHDFGNGQYALMGDTNGDGIADLRILFEYAVQGDLNLIL